MVDGEASEERKIKFGIPQGTILGPLLFLVYVNNLLNSYTTGCIVSFADDTAIVYTADSWDELKNRAESDLINVFNWFSHQSLTVNIEKTFFLPFTCYRNSLPSYVKLTLSIDGKVVEIRSKSAHKYLGVTLDSHLRWNVHVDNMVRTIRPLLYKFKYMRTFLDINYMRVLYYAFVEARLQYGILSWGAALPVHLKKLEVLQKKILKIMFKKENTYPSKALFKESGLLDIRQLYMCNTLMYLYKNKHLMKKVDHQYETRNKAELFIQVDRMKKALGQRSLRYQARRIFNAIPEVYKKYTFEVNSVRLMRSRIKSYIRSLDRGTVHAIINPPVV